MLAEQSVTVDVVDGPPGLVVFAAYDRTTLRHLAVHPEWWGRGVGWTRWSTGRDPDPSWTALSPGCGAWSTTSVAAGALPTARLGRHRAERAGRVAAVPDEIEMGCQTRTVSDDLLEIADDLYGLPLAEFTPATDAKAKELKGDDLGKQVKALKKPSTAAWVVNLLVRREQEQVDQVLTVGEALREAQASMSGDELRALTKQRRQLTAAVTHQARRLAADEGLKVTQAVADQVEATLTAAMVDEECGKAVRSGLLVAALATTGVDEVELVKAVAVPEALGFSRHGARRRAGGAARPARRPRPGRRREGTGRRPGAARRRGGGARGGPGEPRRGGRRRREARGPVDAGAGRDRRAQAQARRTSRRPTRASTTSSATPRTRRRRPRTPYARRPRNATPPRRRWSA